MQSQMRVMANTKMSEASNSVTVQISRHGGGVFDVAKMLGKKRGVLVHPFEGEV